MVAKLCLLLAALAVTACSNRGGYLDSVTDIVQHGPGQQQVVAQCMARAISAQDCDEDYQLVAVVENASAGWTKVICDSRPGTARGGGGSAAAVGSATGALGFAIGLAIDRAAATGDTNINPQDPERYALFSTTLRRVPDDRLEARHWVLFQSFKVDRRQAMLREAFTACSETGAPPANLPQKAAPRNTNG